LALFLADEKFQFPIAQAMRALGHDLENLNRDERSASDVSGERRGVLKRPPWTR
jgi:hypothetical protein